MTAPLWARAGTLGLLGVLIVSDLAFTREAKGTGVRGAAALSALWIAAGLAFGGVLWGLSVSLVVIVVVLGAAVALSVWRDRTHPTAVGQQHEQHGWIRR